MLVRYYKRFFDKAWRPLLVLALAGAALRFVLSFYTFAVFWPDSVAYADWALRIGIKGRLWAHVIYRTPGYPLLMAPLFHFFGHTAAVGWGLLGMQRVFGVVSGLFIFLIGRRIFGSPAVGFVAALLFLAAPRELYYESAVLTEVTFTTLLLAALWQSIRLFEWKAPHSSPHSSLHSLLHYIFLGLVFALLTLVRPIAQFLLVAILVLLVWRHRRAILLPAIACLLAYLAVLAPWISINHHRYHFWGVSKDQGLNLYHRVLDVDETVPPEDAADQEVLSLYKEAKKRPGVTYFRIYYGLLKRRVAPAEADRRMGAFAFEALRHSPATFVPNTAVTFLRFFIDPRRSVLFCRVPDEPPFLCSPLQRKIYRPSFPDSPEMLALRGRRYIMWYMRNGAIPEMLTGLFALGALGTLLVRRRSFREPVSILIVTVLYFALITAIFNRPEDRFRIPVDGLIELLFVWAVAKVLPYLNMAKLKARRQTSASIG